MKKTIIIRFLLGAPIGIAISFLISLLISTLVGDGFFYPVDPCLSNLYGNELNATLIQTVCAMLLGGASAAASVIWQMEEWSILRMTVAHLLVISLAMFPIAWFMYWMPHTVFGVLTYVGIFALIYATIWFSQYYAMKKKIDALNKSLAK